mmetsp:Transcript_23487/g.89228  ORF Transcript_23487/g.89228 Transcript_23487/m.89228 type:complete len:244 (+) Transcript_23487:634-1365(+)
MYPLQRGALRLRHWPNLFFLLRPRECRVLLHQRGHVPDGEPVPAWPLRFFGGIQQLAVRGPHRSGLLRRTVPDVRQAGVQEVRRRPVRRPGPDVELVQRGLRRGVLLPGRQQLEQGQRLRRSHGLLPGRIRFSVDRAHRLLHKARDWQHSRLGGPLRARLLLHGRGPCQVQAGLLRRRHWQNNGNVHGRLRHRWLPLSCRLDEEDGAVLRGWPNQPRRVVLPCWRRSALQSQCRALLDPAQQP